MTTSRPERRTLRIIIALVLSFSVVTIMGWTLGRPVAGRWLLAFVRARTGWSIALDTLRIHPWHAGITIEGLELIDPSGRSQTTAQHIDLRLALTGLTRGELAIDTLVIDGLHAQLPPPAAESPHPRHHLNVRQLLFLQNVAIHDAVLRDVELHIGAEQQITARIIHCSLERTLLGSSSVGVRIEDVAFAATERAPWKTGELKITGTTRLEHWSPNFPYVDDVAGKLELASVTLAETEIDALSARGEMKDGHFRLKPIALLIGQKPITGEAEVSLADQRFHASLAIPESIELPAIGKELEVLETGGWLAGHIELHGEGLTLARTSGEATIAVSHRFHASPDWTNSVNAHAVWRDGRITVQNAQLTSGEATVVIQGMIDLKNKKIVLAANGKAFPLEHLFRNFREPNLKHIVGPTDFDGTFDGWGQRFHAVVHGNTRNGGWDPILVDRVASEFEATYDQLLLKGTIFQAARPTGTADLTIDFGARLSDGDRAKKIRLTGHLDGYDTGPSLALPYGLEGRGGGDITLVGPTTNFSGNAQVTMSGGKWYGVAFDNVVTAIDLKRTQITFHDTHVKLARLDEAALAQPITMTITPEKIRLRGNPLPGVSLDLERDVASRRWTIHKVAYTNPLAPSEHAELTGSLVAAGSMNLHAHGALDLVHLLPFIEPVRELRGLAGFDVTIGGTAADPEYAGQVELKGVSVRLRATSIPLDEVTGIIHARGHTLTFDHVQAAIDDGYARVDGMMSVSRRLPITTDLTITGTTVPFHSADGMLRTTLDGTVSLVGTFPSPLLAGDVVILDGRYRRDFRLLDQLSAEERHAVRLREEATALFNPRLHLHLRNSGDFFIRNNVGDIGLRLNVTADGSLLAPKVGGAIDVTDGKVHYLGLDFGITQGFIEFRHPSATPYLEVVGQKDIGVYSVRLMLHGVTDNLALDLTATSPTGQLEKRDVISLIAFGATESELQQSAATQQGQLSAQMVAAQVSHVVERPVTRFAHIDVFRFEAADPTTPAISRVYIGKQLSDRLSVDFTTDINTEQAQQTVISEYLLTDHLLIKGSRGSNQQFGVRGVVRFQTR